MSDAKHTPGPWTVESVPTTIGHAHRIMPLRACLYVDGCMNPHCQHDKGCLESAANARLVAAAPDLLEAAEEALGELRLHRTSDMGDVNSGGRWRDGLAPRRHRQGPRRVMTDATHYRLANAAGAARVLAVLHEAREESRQALLTAARALDEGDELTVDTERGRILMADAMVDWAEEQLRQMAVFAMEGA